LSAFASAGTYCVAVTDVGQLGQSSDFAVRITFGDPNTRAGGGTITYASVLLPGGNTSRTFTASASGVVTIIVDTLEPQSVTTVNVGVGFPRSDGGGCQVTLSANVTRGSQLGIPVEAGNYCVRVADPGTLTTAASFSMRIVHP
jgi:hypothetical protein